MAGFRDRENLAYGAHPRYDAQIHVCRTLSTTAHPYSGNPIYAPPSGPAIFRVQHPQRLLDRLRYLLTSTSRGKELISGMLPVGKDQLNLAVIHAAHSSGRG